ncbi:unnamed protein product [Candida verbasci]|uniref:Chromosome transmission fidelity protein 8 n=1 Tax=Candida verbasci TaxID=1227364 RepID=A0A9W4TZ72_9ASCO|nr:unnamed protein product [Candida verbasci]
MPTAKIDCRSVQNLQYDGNIITTPYGLTLLEIQGELNLPDKVVENNENFIKVDEIYDAVKFGNLVFDQKETNKVILFIGNSQRLLGTIEKLNTPLGVLKIPVKNDDNMEIEEDIKMIDIVKHKLIFKQRPLPIM